jgi:hypothetical protein
MTRWLSGFAQGFAFIATAILTAGIVMVVLGMAGAGQVQP